ncbi:YaiO family outer membrane beta-barrel protein [Sphingobium bisphenolivorans]|uniref:YaiO family outer membrane beta-barrel protein n=1 Tax=Sphingobium bisphenolivorans TaxID=1335760 RepID=UPI000485D686|nr:YaiO family outer membrane beta-barrel protein [Sphingobium bisphenolivorans]
MSLIAIIAAAPAAAVSMSREQLVREAEAALARKDSKAAVALLERAADRFPGDADILRRLGAAYAFNGRYRQSIATLQRAKAIAPDDLDIRLALARTYLWSGDRSSASREVNAVKSRDASNAEAGQILSQLTASPSPDRPSGAGFGVAVNQRLSDVSLESGADRTWSETSLAVFGPLGRSTSFSLEADREDRKTAVDTRLQARVDHRFSSAWRGYATVAATPDADFREKWSVGGGLEGDLTSVVTLVADLRHAEYRDASITIFQPGMRLNDRSRALSATVRMINLWDEEGTHRAGVSGRIDKEFAGGALVYAGAATYPDTEAGITRQVNSWFLGGALPLSKRVTLRAGIDRDRRESSYTRKGGSLGLQFRF